MFYKGDLHAVARNLYNSVFIIDLTKKDSLSCLLSIYDDIKKKVPVRYGIVPAVDMEKKTEISKF